jgi:O-antigen ligase
MSDIQITRQLGPSASRPSRSLSGTSRQGGLNQTMAWAILVLLALVPLPFGSVHGFSWGFFALYTGLAAVLYVASLARLGEDFRVPLRSLRVQAAGFGLLIGFLVLQLLPIGLLLGPFTYVDAGAATISLDTLSVAPDMTLLMLMRQLTYGAFFFLVLQVAQNDVRRRFVLDATLIIICCYAALAVLRLQTGDSLLIPNTAYPGSATGPFVNRNSFATFLAMGSVIALAQIGRRLATQMDRHAHDGLVPGNFSALVMYAMAYVLLIAVTLATQSRMGLFAAFLGSVVVASVIAFRTVRSRGAVLVALLIILLAVMGGLTLFGEAMFDRIFDLDRSSGIRSDLYAQVLQLIGMRPWTGFGGGAFELAYPLVHAAPVSLDFAWDRAHNTYLTLWSELGVIFGSIPILLLGWVAVSMLRSLIRSKTGWISQTIALGALVLTAAHSLVDFSLEIQANTFVLLTLVAVGVTADHSSTR